MSGPLTRVRLLELFDRLNEKLRQADQHAEVYIVGGAMMALAHDAQRVTDDVDSHIRRGRDAVNRAVAEIAGEVGLSKYWLNEAVTLRRPAAASTPRRRSCPRCLDELTRYLDWPEPPWELRRMVESGNCAGPVDER